MSVSFRRSASLLALLLVVAAARASGVTASLDRDHVQLGDTVTLTLGFSSASAMGSPDLSPLSQDFQVLGQASSSQQSWINGKVKASYQLQITLRPRRAGTLPIPPLDVNGQTTNALTVHVSPGSSQPSGKPGDPVFVKVKLSSDTVYVGEQVALDVRLYYQAALISGSPPVPDVSGARVTRLGGMQRYQSTIGGERYFVAEQHFALVPEKPGKLSVPPVQFRGQMLNTAPMGGFFNNVRPVTAQSAAHELSVKPRPAGQSKDAWLPARQLALSLDGLPASGRVQLGQPLTVTVREGATGLPADDLPEPTLPDLPGADVYPDKTRDETRNNGQWITGSRTRRFAIVPNKAGPLTIPPITLRWWNVVDDRAETAHIPAHTLTVLAAGAPASAASAAPSSAAPAPASSSSAAPSASAAGTPAAATVAPSTPAAVPSPRWRGLALGSLLLWLVSVLLLAAWWWRVRRRRAAARGATEATGTADSARRQRLAYLAAARGTDRSAMARALLAWARVERPAIRHLQDLSAQLDDSAQQDAIEHLQRARFAVDAAPAAAIDMVEPFRHGLRWRRQAATREAEPLPPLYPR